VTAQEQSEDLVSVPHDVVVPASLGLFPLRQTVVYPFVPAQLSSTRPQTVQLLSDVLESGRLLGLVTCKPGTSGAPASRDLYRVGTAAFVQRMWHLPDGSVRLIVQGVSRIGLRRVSSGGPYLSASVRVLSCSPAESKEAGALAAEVSRLFQKLATSAPNLPEELCIAAANIDDPARLADFVAFHIGLAVGEKQALLEDTDACSRLGTLAAWLSQQCEILELSNRVQSQVQVELDKSRREYILREQIRVLQQELGQKDEHSAEVDRLRGQIEASGMPADARREAEAELDRLERMSPAAAEHNVCRTYLDWLVDLPWSHTTQDNLSLGRAREVLDCDHFGLEGVKERILDHLAVRQLKAGARGPVLCLVGPPGVGKTSLGQSVAQAMGRRFVRIALGGLRDEAELRGHRRTYVGAMPGRILQGIRRSGSRNPVFMLDEIDKLHSGLTGDPASVLLEILDPQQNAAFSDDYLGVPFNLSEVLFLATANVLDTIPDALRDRLELVDLPGYTEDEKVAIARRHLIPRQLDANGVRKADLFVSAKAVRRIVVEYTQEAGLRDLERQIAALCRVAARRVAEGKGRQLRVDSRDLPGVLGSPRVFSGAIEADVGPGVATCLAVTRAGGQILAVECTAMPGRQELVLTGQLGDVMRESALTALSYLRSQGAEVGIAADRFASTDIHIHVPEGAVPKDGPSAGVAMVVALASLLTGRAVPPSLAMTGEITLRGRVLPVGGVRDKVLAAARAGLRRVVLPWGNRDDLSEVSESVTRRLRFCFVRTVSEVLDLAIPRVPGRRPKRG